MKRTANSRASRFSTTQAGSKPDIPDRLSSPDLPEPHQIFSGAGYVVSGMNENEVDQLGSDTDDDAASDSPPPTKRPKTSTKPGRKPRISKNARNISGEKTQKATAVDPKLKRIILVIPSIVDGLNDKKMFDNVDEVDFDTVLATIHESLECTSYKVLPELSYKLEGAPAKSSASRLSSEVDWQICVDDALAAQIKKKTNVKVNVLVDQAYMNALKKKQQGTKKGKSKNSGGAKEKEKKAVVKTVHLDGSSDIDENGDVVVEDAENGSGSGILDAEKKHLERLMKRYSTCKFFGSEVACKVNKWNEHVPLTINQLQAWATALNFGQQGVTLDIPPKSTSFSDFHHSISTRTPARKAEQVPAYASTPVTSNPYTAEFGGFLGAFAAAQFMAAGHSTPAFPMTPSAPRPSHATHHSSPELPSSDPYDETEANPYPTIDSFLLALSSREPR
ncbi:hypothetical protein K435DRAFT_876621 [Dendrothele bispora CBS 962.96]|uniref:Uncharacterized protein n=1 Tax=Dendrothele bispora (strain CBS 962.96) TaxID=1314807 RepID=A0A4S8KST4_DENBC|nr:hypothetical protein K435DRAFT_876621 [Dendrothele bispora CBS 962.96]